MRQYWELSADQKQSFDAEYKRLNAELKQELQKQYTGNLFDSKYHYANMQLIDDLRERYGLVKQH